MVFIFFKSVNTIPQEADSINMHIPLANALLDGSFLKADPNYLGVFYPSASEIILSILIILNLPLNLFNFLSVIFLFFSSIFIGLKLNFDKSYSLIFAGSITTLYGIQRWFLTQKIDVWLLCFFMLSLAFLIKPLVKKWDYFFLGLSLGMLTGSKFTGLFFGILLIIFFYKNFITKLSFLKFIIFAVPYSILGLFWYIRNFVGTSNPFYPQPFLFFPGDEKAATFTNYTVTKAVIDHPLNLFNAFLSEYMIWSLTIIFVPIILLFLIYKKRTYKIRIPLLLTVLGFLYLLIYSRLPSQATLDSVIFGVRYSFPAVVLFIISFFYIGMIYKKQELVAKIAIANLSALITISYQPKLLIITVPLTLLLLQPLSATIKPINNFFKTHKK